MARDEGELESYERLLRQQADDFVLTVLVIADNHGGDSFKIANDAVQDAIARLQERGMIGTAGGDEGGDDDAA